MASAMISRYDDTDTEDDGRSNDGRSNDGTSNDGRSIAAATTASYSLVAATSSVDASISAWTHIGEATVATATTQPGWEPFPAANDDESLVWTDDVTIYARKSPGGKKNSTKRKGARCWSIDDDEELHSSDRTLADTDYSIAEMKSSAQSNKRERRSSPLILRRFNSDNSDDIKTNNEEQNESDYDNDNDDADTTYTRKSWMPQWHDAEPQSAGNEVSKRKRCPSCHLSFTCHVVIVVIIILVVFLVLLLFFLFQKGIIAWP